MDWVGVGVRIRIRVRLSVRVGVRVMETDNGMAGYWVRAWVRCLGI